MKTPLHILLLFFTTCLLFTQCKRDEEEIDKLPPATASGLGTFGCLVNGKAWPIYEKGYHYVQVSYQNGMLDVGYYIRENELSLDKIWVHFRTIEVNKPGSFLLSFKDYNKSFAAVRYNETGYFSDASLNKGNYLDLNISRLDTVNGFVSGTFNFLLFNDKGTSFVKVESGRFDLLMP
jgi:hypothetical protein